MSASLLSQLIEYLGQFPGEGPFGLSVRKFEKGRMGNIKEENGSLIFSMERHKCLDVFHEPGDPMYNMISVEEKYIFSPESKEKIDIIGSDVVECELDLYGDISRQLDKNRIEIIKRNNEYILNTYESGELYSETDIERLKETYLENSKSEIEYYVDVFLVNLDDAILEFPNLKDKLVSYKNEITVDTVYDYLLDELEIRFSNAEIIDEDEDDDF